MKSIVVDVHAHFTPKLMSERYEASKAKFPDAKLVKGEKGVTLQFPGTQPTRPIMPGLSDLAGRQAWMDKNGIDHQVIGGRIEPLPQRLHVGSVSRRAAFLRARDRADAGRQARRRSVERSDGSGL